MKKLFTLALTLLLALSCLAGYAEETRTVASYTYDLTEDGAYIENLIFNADVIISGDNSVIYFVNCEFNGDIILTADEGTKVFLLGCDTSGTCILRNSVREASLEYANPKFLVDAPVTVVCEDCVGSVIALGDFEISFSGETHSMASAQFFGDLSGEAYTLVPYEGQEATYYWVAQWYENDQQTVMSACEFDPEM